MANPASAQRRNGRHLWFALLGLGFQPDSEISALGKTSVNVKHINLGPNMFDKPNKDAFYMVTHFLLYKFNPTRFKDSYRHCWPVLDHKADALFRKVTCSWLREILDESANAGSKVLASLFLSPGGPKFTGLMLGVANHVMLQEMKTFRTEDGWVPEAAATPASSLDMAEKRLELIGRRFLRAAVEQDRFLQEYQRRAQLLVTSVKELRAEASQYDQLLQRHGDVPSPGGGASAEKIRQVRRLWSTLDQMVSSIQAQQGGVESVLQGEADQHVLDGPGRALDVPRSLRERVERLPQLSSGRLYVSGQLHLLCVLELMTLSLQVLREEQRRLPAPPPAVLGPAQLQDKRGQVSRALLSLQLIRQKVCREGIPQVRSCLQELEAAWDGTWTRRREDSPLAAFLQEEQALGFLSPMAPLSFHPLAEASSSLFSQFPALLPEEEEPQGVEGRSSRPSRYSPEAAVDTGSPSSTETEPLRKDTSMDWLFDTPLSPLAQVGVRTPRGTGTQELRTEAQTLALECDNLADQFADAVVTPSEGRLRGLDLESLLSTLHSDPFSTRKQLPRTPESLILDVKTSWRRAVEEDRAQKLGQAVDASPGGRSNGGVCGGQQGAPSETAPPLWDTLVADSPSGGVQFSLDQETLPSCDSLLSLDEDEDGDDGSYLDGRATPHQLVPASEQDWPRVSTEKVFSLDLEDLEDPSSPRTQEHVLPSLITFSPVDDMKC